MHERKQSTPSTLASSWASFYLGLICFALLCFHILSVLLAQSSSSPLTSPPPPTPHSLRPSIGLATPLDTVPKTETSSAPGPRLRIWGEEGREGGVRACWINLSMSASLTGCFHLRPSVHPSLPSSLPVTCTKPAALVYTRAGSTSSSSSSSSSSAPGLPARRRKEGREEDEEEEGGWSTARRACSRP